MPSTYTALGFEKQAAGEHNNTWGSVYLNATIDRINYAVAGYQVVTVNGDTTLTSSTSSTTQSDYQAFNSLLKLNGSPSANFTVTVPSVPMQWMFYNATSKTATITTGAGGTVTVEAGDTIPVYCDGSNVRTLSYGSYNLKDYIAAQVLASSTALPGQVGNAGKFIKTDGTNATWQQVQSTDLGDYSRNILGKTVALALALGG